MALPLAAAISQPPSANDYELHYVDCAFDIPLKKEAFLFTGNQCLQFNYAAEPNDRVIKGPLSIGDFFPSLNGTTFAQGIDSAFTSSVENEVYMFKKNLCVLLNFDSRKIIEEPTEISYAFTSLKGTVFEDGIDAAFASHQGNKAYIFNGNQYAVIKFTDGTMVTAPQAIANGFPFLSSIGFAKGLDAAFRSSTPNQAYIFKDDAYAIINYAQGAASNGIIQKVSPISASNGFPSLRDIIPSRA